MQPHWTHDKIQIPFAKTPPEAEKQKMCEARHPSFVAERKNTNSQSPQALYPLPH
jgi:hypothetical protein